jgi:hypothetical protein
MIEMTRRAISRARTRAFTVVCFAGFPDTAYLAARRQGPGSGMQVMQGALTLAAHRGRPRPVRQHSPEPWSCQDPPRGLPGLRIVLPARKSPESGQPAAYGGQQDAEDDPRDYRDQVIADRRVLPGCPHFPGTVHPLWLWRGCNCHGGYVEERGRGRTPTKITLVARALAAFPGLPDWAGSARQTGRA